MQSRSPEPTRLGSSTYGDMSQHAFSCQDFTTPLRDKDLQRKMEIELDSKTIVRELHNRLKKSSVPLATGFRRMKTEKKVGNSQDIGAII